MAGSIEARRSFCREFEQVAITCTPRCLASCMATNESGCVRECVSKQIVSSTHSDTWWPQGVRTASALNTKRVSPSVMRMA